MTFFAYPEMWGWLVVPAAIFLLGLLTAQARRKALSKLGHYSTVNRMLPVHLSRRRWWIFELRVMAAVLFVLALVGPLIGSKLVEFKQRGLDVFIAIDCSLSMQAEDLKPNRMAHAKLLLQQLIDRMAGSRIGIIAFAGQAYVECPLTIDQNAAKETLESIDVGSVPIPGTVIGEAIRVAAKRMNAGEGGGRVLILLTDGEDHHSDPAGAAKEAAKVGLKVYTIGIGTSQGEPIPTFDEQGHRTGFKRDKKGEIVMSRMDPQTLIQIAHDTGGEYFPASVSGDEVESIGKALENLQQGDQKAKLFNRYENRFQWPLAAGIVLFLISLAIPEMGWKKI